MLLFDYNPTHFEPPDKSLELGAKRLDTKPQEEIRKEEEPEGGFAKLLAGLIGKKTHNEASTEAFEGENLKERAEAGQKRKNFLSNVNANAGKEDPLKAETLKTADGKKLRINPEKNEDKIHSSLNGEKQVKKSEKQNQTEKENPGLVMAKHPADDSGKKDDFVIELAAAKELKTEKGKSRTEQSFINREPPAVSVFDDIRNMQLKKGEKPLEADDTADAKKANKKRDRVTVQVRDLRTQTGQEAGQTIEQSVKGVEKVRGQEREIIVDVKPAWEKSREPGLEIKPAHNGETFSQILSRELNGALSTDIVRQAAIVLKDGGEGTIKLSLRPESLGKVKIQLEMSENKIIGQIVVESEEALRAFEQEIHTLEQSFKDSGFEASLSAALDYKNDGQRGKENEASPFFSGRLAASYEETSAIFGEQDGGYGYELSAVNMLA